MNKISAVIITFNEEKRIARCIESVQTFADEIVVVDSFSNDATERICKQYGVVFFQHKFEGYIEQKNFALTKATHDFVFSIDADEEVSEQLAAGIISIKNKTLADAYSMNRLNIYCGKPIHHSGWYPDRKIRLFNRSKCKWGGTNPHDRIEMQQGTTVQHLKGDLIHYSYESITDHVAQQNRFTDIASRQLFEKGKRATLLDIYVRPLWKFIRDYFINLGFLDGYFGFVVCKISAHSVFLKYIKLKQLQSKN